MKRLKLRPLSVNEAYTGRRYSTKKKKAYTNALLLFLKPGVKIFDKMQINLRFGFKNPASDVDNPVKCFVDVLQERYRFNDKNVYKIVVEKVITNEPFIEFEIIEYKP